jgi:hypothetical protein
MARLVTAVAIRRFLTRAGIPFAGPTALEHDAVEINSNVSLLVAIGVNESGYREILDTTQRLIPSRVECPARRRWKPSCLSMRIGSSVAAMPFW